MAANLYNLFADEVKSVRFRKHYSDATFGEKLKHVAKVAGKKVIYPALLLHYMLKSDTVPLKAKLILFLILLRWLDLLTIWVFWPLSSGKWPFMLLLKSGLRHVNIFGNGLAKLTIANLTITKRNTLIPKVEPQPPVRVLHRTTSGYFLHTILRAESYGLKPIQP